MTVECTFNNINQKLSLIHIPLVNKYGWTLVCINYELYLFRY